MGHKKSNFLLSAHFMSEVGKLSTYKMPSECNVGEYFTPLYSIVLFPFQKGRIEYFIMYKNIFDNICIFKRVRNCETMDKAQIYKPETISVIFTPLRT